MKIPRIIHRVWLGQQPLPDRYREFGESWARHHRGWEMRLWTDDRLPELTHPDAYERCRNFAEASDVIRYAVLHRYGGIYTDTDVECRRSLEPLIADAEVFCAWARPGVIGSAVLGSIPSHPAIAKVLAEVSRGAGRGGQVAGTGPVALTRILKEEPGVTIFGPETFYPFDHWDIPLGPDEARPKLDAAYAVHHWDATWQDPDDLLKRKRRLRRQLREARARERAALARLAEIESSRWWRARIRAGSLLGPLRRARGGRPGGRP